MTKLLITNLPSGFDSADLDNLFTTVGDVVSARVEAGRGFVEMVTESAARDAIERFHGDVKQGNRLDVREDRPHVARIRPRPSAAKKLLQKRNAKSAAVSSRSAKVASRT